MLINSQRIIECTDHTNERWRCQLRFDCNMLYDEVQVLVVPERRSRTSLMLYYSLLWRSLATLWR